MIKKKKIQKFSAALMLFIFAFSITPTIFLHNSFASHTDSIKKSSSTDQQQIDEDLFNCSCDHMVAESPFTYPVYFLFEHCSFIYSATVAAEPSFLLSPRFKYYSLRGPPMI